METKNTSRTLEISKIVKKDTLDFLQLINRFIVTYQEMGNASQYLIHRIRVKGWKISSLLSFIYKLHKVDKILKGYIYTTQVTKCFGEIRDMDTMIGILNNENSPRSLVKDFSNRRIKYMRKAYKKLKHALGKYTTSIHQTLDELSLPKYVLQFKDVYKISNIIINEYFYAKTLLMLEPSLETFNKVRLKLKNLKYLFYLLNIYFRGQFKEDFSFLNDFQKSLSYLRDIMSLTSVLSKISLRVSRKKDFVDYFLTSKKNIWKEIISSFEERQIRVDYRLNKALKFLYDIEKSLRPLDLERFNKVIEAIEKFASSYGVNLEKNYVLVDLAESIYEILEKNNLIFGNEFERLVLRCACLVHDVGLRKGEESYHKYSMEAVAKAEIPYIKTKEKLFIALLARYHQRSIPKASHNWYSNLGNHDKFIVNKLAGIIRVSFAICKVTDFNVSVKEIRTLRDGIYIDLTSESDEKTPKSIVLDELDKLLLERVLGFKLFISLV